MIEVEILKKIPDYIKEDASDVLEAIDILVTENIELNKMVTDAYDAIFNEVPEAVDEKGNKLSIADKIKILIKNYDDYRNDYDINA